MLSLVLPKGSLEKATFELFDAADLTVRRGSDRDYRASVDDPRIDRVRVLRPQEIPTYLEQGLFDLGITGRDWITETQADVVSLGELKYSQSGTWALTDAIPGQVNTLLVILEDNAMWEKYVYDLTFYKDGVMVSG